MQRFHWIPISSRVLYFFPSCFLRWLSRRLSCILFWTTPKRCKIGLINIARAYPDLDKTAQKRLLRKHYQALTIALFDRVRLWYDTPDQLRRFITVENLARLSRLDGRPVIIFAPHFVGLDAGAVRLMLERRLAGVYATQKPAAFNRFLLEKRQRFGTSIALPRNQGIRPLLRAARQGYQIYHLPDLDAGRQSVVFVSFFGHAAATSRSLAWLARQLDAVIVPVITWLAPHGYHLRCYPAWEDFPDHDDTAAAKYMNRWLEAHIQQHPEEYHWLHRRYKTQQDSKAPNPYAAVV